MEMMRIVVIEEAVAAGRSERQAYPEASETDVVVLRYQRPFDVFRFRARRRWLKEVRRRCGFVVSSLPSATSIAMVVLAAMGDVVVADKAFSLDPAGDIMTPVQIERLARLVPSFVRRGGALALEGLEGVGAFDLGIVDTPVPTEVWLENKVVEARVVLLQEDGTVLRYGGGSSLQT